MNRHSFISSAGLAIAFSCLQYFLSLITDIIAAYSINFLFILATIMIYVLYYRPIKFLKQKHTKLTEENSKVNLSKWGDINFRTCFKNMDFEWRLNRKNIYDGRVIKIKDNRVLISICSQNHTDAPSFTVWIEQLKNQSMPKMYLDHKSQHRIPNLKGE